MRTEAKKQQIHRLSLQSHWPLLWRYWPAMFFYIQRGIVRQLGAEPHEVAEVAERIARGQLGVEIQHDGKPLVGIMAAMKIMQDIVRCSEKRTE